MIESLNWLSMLSCSSHLSLIEIDCSLLNIIWSFSSIMEFSLAVSLELFSMSRSLAFRALMTSFLLLICNGKSTQSVCLGFPSQRPTFWQSNPLSLTEWNWSNIKFCHPEIIFRSKYFLPNRVSLENSNLWNFLPTRTIFHFFITEW